MPFCCAVVDPEAVGAAAGSGSSHQNDARRVGLAFAIGLAECAILHFQKAAMQVMLPISEQSANLGKTSGRCPAAGAFGARMKLVKIVK